MMKDIFFKAATTIEIEAVQNWKESGGKIVGYTCSFMHFIKYFDSSLVSSLINLMGG